MVPKPIPPRHPIPPETPATSNPFTFRPDPSAPTLTDPFYDAASARVWLASKNLIPDVSPPSISTLSQILHTISQSQDIPHLTSHTIRAIATSLKDSFNETLATSIAAKTSAKILNSINHLISDITKSRDHLESTTTKLDVITNNLSTLPTPSGPPIPQPTWASIVNTPLSNPTHSSPNLNTDKLQQRLRLADRSVLITLDPNELITPGDTSPQSMLTIKNALNTKLATADSQETTFDNPDDPKRNTLIRGIQSLKRGALLIELNTTQAAIHFKDYCISTPNDIITPSLGASASLKPRQYNLIVKFVPCDGSFNPADPTHRTTLEHENNLEQGSISSASWIKNPERRSPSQTVASLRITCINPHIANYIIKERFYIAGTIVKAYKDLKEPLRCNKCQTYGHIRAKCTFNEHCALCASPSHVTAACNPTNTPSCVSCGPTSSHASFHRICPTFKSRCAAIDSRYPENSMPYFPTEEQWTWSHSPVKLSTSPPQATPMRNSTLPPSRAPTPPPPASSPHPTLPPRPPTPSSSSNLDLTPRPHRRLRQTTLTNSPATTLNPSQTRNPPLPPI